MPAGDREQDERQRQRGLQRPGLAFADAKQEHRHNGRCGQPTVSADCAARLDHASPVEGRGQVSRLDGGHDKFPELSI